MEYDRHGVGYEAARLLHRLIRGMAVPAKPILVPPLRLVTRQSSDVVAVDDPEVATCMRFIRYHAHEPIGIKHVLAAVPIARRTMERRFRELVGRSPKEEIARIRLERAKRLLEETDLKIPRVAERSGFIRPVIFSEFFRRETDMTPIGISEELPLETP